jgi:protein involved in polysaccharide export with SLBB domain
MLLFNAFILTLICTALFMTGCRTTSQSQKSSTEATPKTGALQPEPLVLREGDIVRVDFPGAPSLNVRETIKRDGKISLLVGEVEAAGKTIAELQKVLLDLYSPQLVTKIVVVSAESANYPVYITGAVSRSGKHTFDRPVTALEAVLEAGVDLGKANLKGVRLTRNSASKPEVIFLNLDRTLKGRGTDVDPVYLKPGDILYVPQKFQWF